MSSKALAYAEDKLGVHDVFKETVQAHEELDKLLGDLDKAQDTRRGLTAAIEDRTYELLGNERSKHADMSATALDQHMKQVKHKDDAMKQYRIKLDEVHGEIQGLEYDAEILKMRIRIGVARMEQLGGYLNYLAAVKQADTLTKDTKGTQGQ